MTQHDDHDDICSAAQRGDLDEVAALLSIDNRLTRATSKDGWTPLHLAAHFGHAPVVDVLIANNADVNVRTTDGRTALALAEAAAQTGVAALLRARGAV